MSHHIFKIAKYIILGFN